MALPRLRAAAAAAPEAEIPVPRVADDPRHREAAELLTAFTSKAAALERLRIRLVLQHELLARPKSASSDNHRLRLAQLDAEDRAAEPPPQTSVAQLIGADDPVIKAGLQVVAGGRPPPRLSHGETLVEIDAQLDALRRAIFAQTDSVKEIAEQVSHELALQIQPAWNDLQVELFGDAQRLARTTDKVRALRDRVVQSGIISVSTVLRMPSVSAPLRLGSEADYSSEISVWRRILLDLDIIK